MASKHRADELFSRVRNPAARIAIEEERQETFEAGIVKRILQSADTGRPVSAWRAAAKADLGIDDFTFEWFHLQFVQFPVRLGSEKLPNIHKVTVADLFGPGFMKTPFMQAYQKLQATIARDDREERVGLVFNWPHVPTASTMVLHNYPIEHHRIPDPSMRTERNTRIVRPFGNPPVVYVIDPLPEFLVSVGQHWAEV